MLITDFKALVAGIFVGVLFARLSLPAPAPPALAGILGIVGIFVGFKLSSLF